MVYFLCKAYDSDRQNCYFAQSLPVRGAWVEIWRTNGTTKEKLSLPVRGAWVEMLDAAENKEDAASLPVRGAWVEMCVIVFLSFPGVVAPRAGSVG